MFPDTWKKVIGKDDTHDHKILIILHETETVFVRMIHGVATFFVEQLPVLFRRMLSWLYAKFVLTVRIAVKLTRVIAVILAWLCIVFGALVLFPGIISGTWASLAMIASAWGLKRRLKRQTALATTVSSGALFEVPAN